jgi:adenylate cyclase
MEYPWNICKNITIPFKSYQNYLLSKVYSKEYQRFNNNISYKLQKESICRLSKPKSK